MKNEWHDIRKNPDDLPEVDKRLLFVAKDDYYGKPMYFTGVYECEPWLIETDDDEQYCKAFFNDDAKALVTRHLYTLDRVYAWKYIEPFSSANEENMTEIVIYSGWGYWFVPDEVQKELGCKEDDDTNWVRMSDAMINWVKKDGGVSGFEIVKIPSGTTDFKIYSEDGYEWLVYVKDGKIHDAE